MRLLIAGGGTGGHIYPALAVANALRRRPGAPELDWVGGRRGLEDGLVPAGGHPAAPARCCARCGRVERDIHLVLDPLRLALSVPQALWWLLRRRPAAIFTTGGYVAIPVLLAARLLGIPALLWEGNVIPGRSVRATARLASALAVSFEATCAALSSRGTVLRDRHADPRRRRHRPPGGARAPRASPPDERLVVVFGGSQAVRRLNDAVRDALPVARRAGPTSST